MKCGTIMIPVKDIEGIFRYYFCPKCTPNAVDKDGKILDADLLTLVCRVKEMKHGK
jgi:hypothetical protein